MKILFELNPYNQQRQKEKQRWIFPIKLAMYATALRNQNHDVIWDKKNDGSYNKVVTSESQIDIPFLQLPHADRILTDAFNPKWQNNGNFKYRPGVYIQSSNTCWYKKCSFCIETTDNQQYELRSVDDVISEIEECKLLNAKEVFDDSGTFPVGDWLHEFAAKLAKISSGLHFSCNMRMVDLDYSMLRRSGFRMLLFGLESANQKTLDKINKGVCYDSYTCIIDAAKAGIDCHVAVMFGYPWETDADALRTLKLVWTLLRKGYAKTAQASFYTTNEGSQEAHRKYVKRIYRVARSPEFWFSQLRSIKNIDDIKYIWRGIKEGINNYVR